MNPFPRLESRVRAQEEQQTMLNARIIELSEDITASLRQVRDDQLQTNCKIDAIAQDMASSFRQKDTEI